MLVLLVPYFVILVPFLDYIAFQWLAFVLKYFYAKTTTASADIGNFVMTMMLTTFFYFEFILAPWFIFRFEHGCGPIANGLSGFEPLLDYIKAITPYHVGYFLLTFPPLVYIALIAVFALSAFTATTAETRSSFAESKMAGYQ